jgi:predicted aspartyl protease
MIIGCVDDYGRSLVPVSLYHPITLTTISLEAWIDTGFTGALMLASAQISALGLPRASTVGGTLGDGSQVTFDTYSCQIDWFGRRLGLDALETRGRFALIGIPLLQDCTLVTDYPARTLSLTALPGLPSFP